VVRYAGEWVAAGRRRFARAREDAAERVEVEYEPLPHVIEAEKALAPGAPLVHPSHGSNVLYHASSYGARSRRRSQTPSTRSPSARCGAAARPCDQPSASPRSGTQGRESSTSGPRSDAKFPDQTRARCACRQRRARALRRRVGGSYGVKRGIKHTVLVGYLAKNSALRCA